MSTDRPRLAALLAPRASRGQLLVALLCGLLGFGLAVQVRSSGSDPRHGARSEDLVRILADLDARSERLRGEIDALRATRDRLSGGADATGAALAEAQRRERALGELAGTVPADGPGLTITISDPRGQVRADVVLDAVEELRGAGAEALQIDGVDPAAAVRIVASTWFADAVGGGVVVDGRTLRPPYVLRAVGDPETLGAAVRIPGGVVDTVGRVAGARALPSPAEAVGVSALHVLRPPRYASPAPTPTGPPGG